MSPCLERTLSKLSTIVGMVLELRLVALHLEEMLQKTDRAHPRSVFAPFRVLTTILGFDAQP